MKNKVFDDWRDNMVAAFKKARDNAAADYQFARELTNSAFKIYEAVGSIEEARRARQVLTDRRANESATYGFYVAASEAYQAALDLATRSRYEQEVGCGVKQ